MPSSLVTGGAGFLGSHVADRLLELGHRVIVLDDLSGGCRDNVPASATFVQGSVLDASLVDRIFQEHAVDYVYHLAAYAAEGLSHFIKRFNYQNNLVGSVNLINAAVNYNVKCFVFTSSIAVYGSAQSPMTEDMKPIPEDSYGIAKLAVEQELKISHEVFGLDYVIFRPHNVYGERQNIGDRYRNVVGIFMNQLMRGESMTVFGDGTQVRAFTYIGDIAPLIAESVNTPSALNQIFNLGADTPYKVNDLAQVVANALGVECRIEYLEPRKEVKVAFSDHRKAQTVFGMWRETLLRDGIHRMAEWVERHGSRESNVFEEIEIAKNMPPSWARVVGVRACQ